jgi:hypothetical protein
LREYCRDWDDRLKVFKDSPKHNWASHAADSFCYTMPPCDLQELFKTAWEAANHAPNRPDEPNKRLDRARKALVDALMELGLIHATGVSA